MQPIYFPQCLMLKFNDLTRIYTSKTHFYAYLAYSLGYLFVINDV